MALTFDLPVAALLPPGHHKMLASAFQSGCSQSHSVLMPPLALGGQGWPAVACCVAPASLWGRSLTDSCLCSPEKQKSPPPCDDESAQAEALGPGTNLLAGSPTFW